MIKNKTISDIGILSWGKKNMNLVPSYKHVKYYSTTDLWSNVVYEVTTEILTQVAGVQRSSFVSVAVQPPASVIINCFPIAVVSVNYVASEDITYISFVAMDRGPFTAVSSVLG